jgi:hypothetical protein
LSEIKPFNLQDIVIVWSQIINCKHSYHFFQKGYKFSSIELVEEILLEKKAPIMSAFKGL